MIDTVKCNLHALIFQRMQPRHDDDDKSLFITWAKESKL